MTTQTKTTIQTRFHAPAGRFAEIAAIMAEDDADQAMIEIAARSTGYGAMSAFGFAS